MAITLIWMNNCAVLFLRKVFFLFSRVHELFLYDNDTRLKRAKFKFTEVISHRDPETKKLDMQV